MTLEGLLGVGVSSQCRGLALGHSPEVKLSPKMAQKGRTDQQAPWESSVLSWDTMSWLNARLGKWTGNGPATGR